MKKEQLKFSAAEAGVGSFYKPRCSTGMTKCSWPSLSDIISLTNLQTSIINDVPVLKFENISTKSILSLLHYFELATGWTIEGSDFESR
jgi:hypothetical protein